MKSLIITLLTLLFLVVSFVTMTASSDSFDSNHSPNCSTDGGQYSWKPDEVWCYDPFGGQFRWVTQCDESGGACNDQYCPCTGHIIEM
ncbi:hypothetical protein [Neolewinella persica]|uniref:hypothetical protein n=1 Tax=Neolewinella persica TaxID=70998 RepID=UPI0012FCD58D|nr:hypothetical protein [Neolewinella persica]